MAVQTGQVRQVKIEAIKVESVRVRVLPNGNYRATSLLYQLRTLATCRCHVCFQG